MRLDAVHLLDLFLEYIPGYVGEGLNLINSDPGPERSGNEQGNGRKVLDGYLGLLNAGASFGENEDKVTGSSGGLYTGGQSLTLITLSPAVSVLVIHAPSNMANPDLSPSPKHWC